jgi:hypothetical protein
MKPVHTYISSRLRNDHTEGRLGKKKEALIVFLESVCAEKLQLSILKLKEVLYISARTLTTGRDPRYRCIDAIPLS